MIGTINSGKPEFNQSMKYDDYCIRELAFDLGIDLRLLKSKLQSIFNFQASDNGNQNNLQFHL